MVRRLFVDKTACVSTDGSHWPVRRLKLSTRKAATCFSVPFNLSDSAIALNASRMSFGWTRISIRLMRARQRPQHPNHYVSCVSLAGTLALKIVRLIDCPDNELERCVEEILDISEQSL